MKVLNALQLKKGAKVSSQASSSGLNLTQPIQFLTSKKKNDNWAAWNLDWLENQGMMQLRNNARKILKNYKLAKGIIDKSDYIIEEDNEYKDLMDVLTHEDSTALQLKFYPIIPNVVNVLSGEFSKRYSRVQFRAVDDLSYNEMIEEKRGMIEENLLNDAKIKIMSEMSKMGVDIENDEKAQQELQPEKLKTLPEIEEFFQKDYRSLVEEWAMHQLKVDEERFKMQELEERGFRDMLICDREFWHFRMMEDDYDVELWNPALTFYQKSPDTRYISDGNYVGKCEMMTVSDVIDCYGYLMTEKQLRSLQEIHPAKSARYQLTGYQNDGTFYDPTKSHKWNTNSPSLGMRQFMSNYNHTAQGSDVIDYILGQGEDYATWGDSTLMRVTTAYWKTQRKVGHLTRVLDDGSVEQHIIDENWVENEKPIYNTNLFKNKTRDNLVQGEHVDWIWINEVWGGVKLGPNSPTSYGTEVDENNVNPIYLGINKSTVGRVEFQFKGDNNLYGCKLPVEGRVFSDRNTRSTSLVDLMKAYQVGYNMVNNQIADILVDELGTVIMFDQNALPRHSMGEDWGKNNYAKAYVAMKDFGMLPLDTSITNTENATNFNHYQTLNLEQTNRLMSRIQLANHFKAQAFEAIGVNPQRLGQEIARQTATGVQQAVQSSYSQTEMYFTQHSDNLMPRVHKMRTDLSQYYHSTKPSVRLNYISSQAEKVNFTINGTELLMRDFNIFCTTRSNHRATLDQLKQLAIQNNTSGASIFDLGSIIKADSIAEVSNILKGSESKQVAQRQQEMQQQQQMQQEQLQAQAQEKAAEREFQTSENQAERDKDLAVAQIRSSRMEADVTEADINKSFDDAEKSLAQRDQFREKVNMARDKNTRDIAMSNNKTSLDREKIMAQRDIANTKLEIAKENKNKYDVKSDNSKKKKDR